MINCKCQHLLLAFLYRQILYLNKTYLLIFHSLIAYSVNCMIDFAYAPPFSRTWDIMNVAGNVAK
ncbi:hypothetical protein ETN89_10760 [Photobacterium damselae subsp. damselae]|nr:hypothetical protein CAY62_09050 [Photobacterium damselae subsp. damselae]QAY35755.1 hypothetical protein ETN89_10760 [Photobacterium damselae subsp. damselae]